MKRMLMWCIALCGLALMFSLCSVPKADAWYNANWNYRAEIQIDNAFVENENFTNFPMLITITLDDAKTMDNGDDILFTDSTGDVKIPHEIENFDSENLIAWVRIPTLYDTDNTTIYVYYGNSGTSNQENIEGVWDDNYVGVWHLYEDPTGTIYDSTSNSNDGTSAGSMTSADNIDAKIFKGLDMDSTDYIDFDNDASLSITGDLTISMWVQSFNADAANKVVFLLTKDTQKEYEPIYYDSAATNANDILFRRGGNLDYLRGGATENLEQSTWRSIVITDDGTTGIYYMDGVEVDTIDTSGFTPVASTTATQLKARGGGTLNGAGMFDETRLSNVSRSENYIYTSYLIENDPSGAVSIGVEENIVTIAVANATASNVLVDRKQDFVGSSSVLTTVISVQVTSRPSENADSLTDNVHIWVYDADSNLVVDNAPTTDNTLVDENTINFHFAAYNPADAMADASLGNFRVYAEATDNAGTFDNSNNTTAFVVDDGDNIVLTQENLPRHRHRIYGTAARVSGGATTLNSAVRVDNNVGSAQAQISENVMENTYYPSDDGTVYFEYQLNTVLDGVSDNLDYAFPNIAPQITLILADNTLIDRDQDYANSTAVTGTTITTYVRDLDGYADIISAWIAVRDNADVMRDNENVYSTATVVNENTYGFTMTFNPLDSLPDNSLGDWDVDVLVADNYEGSTNNNWGIPVQDENFEDTLGWIYYETGAVSQVDHEQSTAFVKEGTYSHRIWTEESGASVSNGYYRRAAAIDFTELSEILFWTQRSTKPPDSAVYFFTSPDNSSWTILWRIWDITENVEDEVEMDVTGYRGEYFVMFGVLGKGVGHSTDYYFDDLRLRGFGDNVFKVDDLNVPVNYPENIYVGWNTTVSGTITRLSGDNASVDNVRIVDDVEGTFNIGAGNSYSQTYLIDGSMFSDNVGVTVSACDGPLDGETVTSYLVSDNALYEITIRWEDNYGVVSWVPDANRPLELTFQWNGGSENYTMTSNPENVTVDSSGIAMTWVRVNDNDVYWRKVIPEFSGGQVTLVIVEDFTTVDQYQFFLQDYTALYIPPDGQLIFRKWIGTTLAEISGDYWGADWRSTAWLITAEEYQVWVQGVDAPLILIGPLTAFNPSEEKTIIVRIIDAPLDPIYDYVSWAAWRDNVGIIRAEYRDNLDNTTTANVSIYNMAGTLVAEYQPDNEWFIITYTMGDNALSYNVVLTANHGVYGTITYATPVGPTDVSRGVEGGASGPFNLPDGVTLAGLASVIAMTVIGLAFDETRIPLGMIGMAFTLVFFWYMGMLPLPGPYDGAFTATLFVVVAALFAVTWRRRR